MTTLNNPEQATPKLRFGRMLVYSLASAGLNIFAITIGTWMIYFYAPPPDSGTLQYLPAVWLGSWFSGGHLGCGDRPVHWSFQR